MGSRHNDRPAPAAAVLRARETERGPLSYGQQRLLFLDRWLAGSPVYNMPATYRFTGPLDADRLIEAVNSVAARHDVLFTVFEDGADGPWQRVARRGEIPCPVIDLRELGAERAEERARQLVEQDAVRPFDLAEGPMLRATLFRLADDVHLLQLTFHHIACDGWSIGVFQRQLTEAYRAGGTSAEPAAVQYADYALWQREAMAGASAARSLEAWSRALSGAPAVLDLGADRPRPAEVGYAGRTEQFALTGTPLRELEKFAADEGVTLYVVLAAAFQALVSRHSGSKDIVLGSPTAGRGLAALEELVGFFADLLVIRTGLDDDPTFRALVGRTRVDVLDALSRSKVPFDVAVNHLHPQRNLSYSPVVQVVFVLNEQDGAEDLDENVRVERSGVHTGTAKYDLTWSVYREADGLRLEVEYATDLFDAATVQAFVEHWEALLRQVVADPELTLSQIDLRSAAEAERIRLWSDADKQLPAAAVHDLVAQSAAARPDAVAVSCGGQSLTFAELDARATALARRLRGLGVGPEKCVGICAERSADMVVACLAILKAGGVYVPLDTAFPADRMSFMLEDVGAQVVLVHGPTADAVPAGPWRVIDIDETAANAAPETGQHVEALPQVHPDNGCYVIFTSGSTGRPKGTTVTHRNVARLIRGVGERLPLGPDDVWSVFHSFAFDVSVFEMWGALITGGRLVVVPYAVSRDAEAVQALVRAEGVTIFSQTPSAFRQFEAADEQAGGELSLRAVLFAGEALHRPSVRRWASRHGYDAPLLVNLYGITETTVHTTYVEQTEEDLDRELSQIGRPLPDLSVYVLDERGLPCPVGVTGEIHVGGAGLARGYTGRPGLTAARFIPDHVTGAVGARLYRSGDLGRWNAHGGLEYVGRADFQVKIRGYRIETGEIETVLESHPGVRAAAVVARVGADGQADLAGYLVPEDQAPSLDELRAWLRARLPDYMVPRHLVTLAALPLTAQGKVDRRALPEPDAVRPELGQEYVAPLGPVEEALAEIWCRVLSVDRVGRHDNFFELGGDSIRSIHVLGQARVAGLSFDLQDLFRSPTPAGLAAVVKTVSAPAPGAGAAAREPFSLIRAEERALLPEGLEDAYPMAELQVGMIYEMELNPSRRAYLNVDGIRIIGPFDEARFREATARVVARHPIMRTGFDLSGFSVPMQFVYRTAEMPFTVADLRGLDEEARELILGEYVSAERRRPFDHARPLLLRFAVHRLTDDAFQWTITEHHAVFDGWSLHSTMSEIADVYQRLLAGEDPVLGPPASSYRDFIAAERAIMASETSKRFWLDRLAGRTDRRLPRWSGERPARLTGRTCAQEWRKHQPEHGYGFVETLLPEELCLGLRDLARRCEVPLKSVMLAAQLKVVSLITGSPDVLIGVTAHGRLEEPGGADVRGLFLNTLPFRMELPGGSWRDLIRAVFGTESELLPHRRYPLGAVQRELGGDPLFEVNFVYNHFHVMDKGFGPGLLRIEDGKIDSFSTDRAEPTNFPLNVGVIRSPYSDRLLFGMDYHTDVLAPEQVLLYRDYYVRVLEEMVSAPEAGHRQASLLGEAERALLESWTATEGLAPSTSDATVHALVSAAAKERPDALAVGYDGDYLTYRELGERADALARRLRRLGVGPEVCVGVCLERSWEAVVVCLAVLRAGGVYVPLDTAFPAERIEFMLRDVAAPLVVVHAATAGLVPSGAWELVDAGAREDVGDVELPEVHPDNGCYVIFTSGSTGRPKGTMVTHRNVVRLVSAVRERLPLGPEDVFTLFHSFAFDASVFEMWGALITGARLVVVPYAVSRDAEAVQALVRAEGVTIFSQTPSAFRQFEAADEQAGGELSLRAVLFGGEALHRPSVRRFASRHGYDAPRLVNLFGITETTVHVTWLALDAGDVEGDVSPIGRPLPDLGVQVLDDHGTQCPVGVVGELYVSGAGLTRGYVGRPALTAQRFVPDHLSGDVGARLYRSGDLGRWNEHGRLEYLGRADSQVKIRGYRIETGEIESVLVAHDQLRQAAVVPHTGSDGRLDLVAYLVPEGAGRQAPPAEELRAWIGKRLPDYMIPRHFVTLDALPLTVQGKLDRRALPEPQAVRPDLAQEYVAPVGPVEEALAEIWCQVLGVDRVGRQDNFFVLGGDSIRSIQVLGRARDAGLDFSLQDVNQRPTLEALAGAVAPRRAGTPPPTRTAPFALLSEQDRALLAARSQTGD